MRLLMSKVTGLLELEEVGLVIPSAWPTPFP